MDKKINIQILRILACLGVFTVHFGQRFGLTGHLRAITDFGAYGVQLFMILSGYLAFMSLKQSDNINILNYYKKRAVRLLPLYYIVILYFFITETFLWEDIPADKQGLGWLRCIFLLNGFVGNDTYFWSNLGITWTIPIFAFFYLIAPFLVKIIKKLWQAILLFFVAYIISFFCGRYISGNLNNILYLKYFRV